MPKFVWLDETKPFNRHDYFYLLARSKTKGITSNPRLPDLAHDLIECSVCHKLIEEPNIEECEFCNEDVCDNCWDKHQCESEVAHCE